MLISSNVHFCSSPSTSHIKMTRNGVTCAGAYSSTSGRRKRPDHTSPRIPLTLALLALAACWPEAAGLDPKFDPSTRMGLVLVPADATVGSVIYRLRASDEEFEYPLQFELVGRYTNGCPGSRGTQGLPPVCTTITLILIVYFALRFLPPQAMRRRRRYRSRRCPAPSSTPSARPM